MSQTTVKLIALNPAYLLGKEYVNQTSDMFSAYEKGEVTYKD